ncbi:MAG: LacI family DNA-binding transcriptional regulator [Lentisphaeria bacterium]|nr:LacI family DNA-binding transcriptional regulator [Lentisphaeria bacterium]
MSCVTLRQVAELTGKSEATVSLVLNSKQFHRVSEETRTAIQRVAAELGYVPNMQAQALVKGRTRSIAITSGGMTPFYNEYIRALTHLLEKNGYNVFAFETMLKPEREQAVVNWVRQGLYDGCICLEYNYYTRSFYDSVVRAGIPHAFRGWNVLERYPGHMVRVDYRRAIKDLFAHLAGEGWKRLGIIIDGSSYDEEAAAISVRRSLYFEAAHDSDMKIDSDGWIVVPFDVEKHLHYVYGRTRELLESQPQIDSMIVQSSSDIPAVYKAAADAGRKVGADLAVATFDLIPQVDFMQPPVTCIMEPAAEIAELISKDILQQLGVFEEALPEGMHPVEARLIVNESTRRTKNA